MKEKLLRYSKSNPKKLKISTLIKLHNKKNESIIMDTSLYQGNNFEDKDLYNIKNIIIDADKFKNQKLKIDSSKVENVYFLNEQNLGGLTIPVDILYNNNLDIKLYWNDDYKSNIKEINFIYGKNKVESVNLEGIKKVSIETTVNDNDKNPFEIKINLEFDKTYDIDKLFTRFCLTNIDCFTIFNEKKAYEYLSNDDWGRIFSEGIISNSVFHELYNRYLEYIKHLKRLKELGFSYKALIYLHDKNFNNMTRLYKGRNDNVFDYDSITQTEISCFNEIGKEYVKSKRNDNYGK